MMKKLIVLMMALAIAVPALADDFMEPPAHPVDPAYPVTWRGAPGSMYMEWTYDAAAPGAGMGEAINDHWDAHDVGSFVPHPEKEDPGTFQGDWEEWGYEYINGVPYDPCYPDLSYAGTYGAQQWAGGSGMPDPGDPCGWIDTAPVWVPSFVGRTGVMLDWVFGSWDMHNFVHDQPAKDMWVQLTYFNGDEPGVPVMPEGDPCEGYYVGFGYSGGEEEAYGWWGLTDLLTAWDYETYGDPMYTWVEEDPCSEFFGEEVGHVYTEGSLAEWDPCDPDPLDTWMQGGEFWAEGELVSSNVLEDGWIQDVYAMTSELNPDWEWFEMGFGEANIAIDQIIIETLCYVPEPTTMVLLGLGSLLMIRRKRR